jgi:AraC-like DNA-binding protein
MAYLNRPGDQERFAHPHAGGDECLAIDLEANRFAEIFDGDRLSLSVRTAVPLTARVAVAHRLLLAAEHDERAEAGLALLREIALCIRDPTQQTFLPRISAHARRLALDARGALADDPTLTLHQLATKLSVSSHHLSRTFSAVTGRGVARHRTELRISGALDRLSSGEDNLARLAADLGFADHAHLTRTIRRYTGRTPSQLRGIRNTTGR